MKAKKITYWVVTVILSAFMAYSAVLYLSHQPKVTQGFAQLGYPSYFPNLLGVFKLLGVFALLVPGFAVVKEWAYAGFGITFISAFVSHTVMGQGAMAIAPVIAFIFLAASYLTRPASRKLPGVILEPGRASAPSPQDYQTPPLKSPTAS